MIFLLFLTLEWGLFKDQVLTYHHKIPGWCSEEKALRLMDFVHQTKPELIVEIGSFGGSTTFPLAMSLSFNKKGHLYAIDAWDNDLATEGFDLSSSDYIWWKSLDFTPMKKTLFYLIREHHLTKIVSVFSTNSQVMVHQLADQSIDLLYLDGNFSAKGSYLDLQLYYPKVKAGGYIILNNSDSPSKKQSLNFLMNECSWLKTQSIGKQCSFFQKL